jgi:hypothetical protein
MNGRVAGKIILGLTTGGMALMSAYGVVSYMQDYRSAGPVPAEMRIEEAITPHSVSDGRVRWVHITTKMVPTCETLKESQGTHVDKTTYLVLDETKKYGLLVEFEGNVGCDEAAQRPMEGLLMPAKTAFWESSGGSVPQTLLPLMRLIAGRKRDYYLKSAGIAGGFMLVIGTIFVFLMRIPTSGPYPLQAAGAAVGRAR